MLSGARSNCYNFLTMLAKIVSDCCTAVFDRFQEHLPGESLLNVQVPTLVELVDEDELCALAQSILPIFSACLVMVENRRGCTYEQMPQLTEDVFTTLYAAIKSHFSQSDTSFHLNRNLQIAVLLKCKHLLEENYQNTAQGQDEIEYRKLSTSIYSQIIDQLIQVSLNVYSASKLRVQLEPLRRAVKTARNIRGLGQFDCISPMLVRQSVMEALLTHIAFTHNPAQPGVSLEELTTKQICFCLLALGIDHDVNLETKLSVFLDKYQNEHYWKIFVEKIKESLEFLTATQKRHLCSFTLSQLMANNSLNSAYHKAYVKKVASYWRASAFIFGFIALFIAALALLAIYIINRNSIAKLPDNTPITARCSINAVYQGADGSGKLYYLISFLCFFSRLITNGQYAVNTVSPNQYACNGFAKSASCSGQFNGTAVQLTTGVWSATTGVNATGSIGFTSTGIAQITPNPYLYTFPLPDPSSHLRGFKQGIADTAHLFLNGTAADAAATSFMAEV